MELPRRYRDVITYEIVPSFDNQKVDFTNKWGELLQGSEAEFPYEASYANHYFFWPHLIGGKFRAQFDCRDPDSYRLIPPEEYLRAYWNSKTSGDL